ncbi:hypothetical protein ACHAXN_012264 [Cyclotella atomus]
MDDTLQEPSTNAIEHNPSSTNSNAAKRSSDNSDSTNDNPNKRSKKSAHPQCITQILNEWITANSFNPYPSQQEKIELMHSTGLSEKQLSDWFSKARKKMGLISKSQENVEESSCGLETDSTCGVARVSLSPETKVVGASESDEIRDEDVVDEKERNVCTVSISCILQEEKHKMPEVKEQSSQRVQKIATEASKIVEAANATTKAVDSTTDISCGTKAVAPTGVYYQGKVVTGRNTTTEPAPQPKSIAPTGISIRNKAVIETTVHPSKATTEPAPTSQPKAFTETTVHPRKATTESAPAPQPTTQRQNTTVGLSESAKEYISKWIRDNSHFPTKYQKSCIMSHLNLDPILDAKKLDGFLSRQRAKFRKEAKIVNENVPSCTEVDSYLYQWMSRTENVGNFSPSVHERAMMEKESGIESRRIESWFYRLRKRMKKQAREEGVSIESLQGAVSNVLVKEKMVRDGLLYVEDEEKKDDDAEVSSGVDTGGMFDQADAQDNNAEDLEVSNFIGSAAAVMVTNQKASHVTGLDIISNVASQQVPLSPLREDSPICVAQLVTRLSKLNSSDGTEFRKAESSDDQFIDGFGGSLFSSMITYRAESPTLSQFFSNA